MLNIFVLLLAVLFIPLTGFDSLGTSFLATVDLFPVKNDEDDDDGHTPCAHLYVCLLLCFGCLLLASLVCSPKDAILSWALVFLFYYLSCLALCLASQKRGVWCLPAAALVVIIIVSQSVLCQCVDCCCLSHFSFLLSFFLEVEVEVDLQAATWPSSGWRSSLSLSLPLSPCLNLRLRRSHS